MYTRLIPLLSVSDVLPFRLIFSLHLSVTNILEAEKKIKQKGISKRIKKNTVKQEEKENENEKMRKKIIEKRNEK